MESLFFFGLGIVIGTLINCIFKDRNSAVGSFHILPADEAYGEDDIYLVNIRLPRTKNLLTKRKIILYADHSQK